MTTTAVRTDIATTTAGQLRAALDGCLSTVGDKTEPVLHSVRVVVDGDSLTFTSTDRFRATWALVMLDHHAGQWSAVVPADDIKRFAAALPRWSDQGAASLLPVSLTLEGSELTMHASGVRLTARVLEVTYPDVDRILDSVVERGEQATTSIAFGPAFLTALAKMPRGKNDPIRLRLGGAARPAWSTWTVTTGSRRAAAVDFTYLIMPARVASA